MVAAEPQAAETPQDAPQQAQDAPLPMVPGLAVTTPKRIETSKLMLFSVLIFCGLGATASVVGWFMGLDNASGMLYGFLGLAGTVTSWYVWKAKAEQLHKNAKGIDMSALPTDTQKAVIDIIAREQIQGGNSYNSYSGGYYSP